MRPDHIEYVLMNLHEGQWFGFSDPFNKTYENLEIYGDYEKPTKDSLESELSRLQADYDGREYARNRQAEYPSVNELIVALWEGVVEERMAAVTQLEAKRQAVKLKYPK